jgi:hypothetical protein
MPMGQVIVIWGKFKLELPGEIFFFLLLKVTSSLLHYVNV